ncbi:MAG: hypothetical protein AB1640_16705 [bacterium]
MILESLTGSDALSILKILAERHDKLAQEIDAIAEELLPNVDVEELAADVKGALELLDVEDVWDRSGERRDGYVDPGDAAWQMFDEALDPFRHEIEKYRKLSMLKEVNLYYQGILKGIHDFDKESTTEYKQWAADAPGEYFGQVLNDWKALPKGRLPLSEMREFIDGYCPDYAEWGARLLRSRR